MKYKKYLVIALFCTLLYCINTKALSNESNYVIASAVNQYMVLDIAGATAKENANIQTFDYHGNSNQQWLFEQVDNNVYIIKSAKDNNYCVGMNTEQAQFHSNIQVNSCNGSNQQKWIIEEKNGYFEIKNIEGDYYFDIAGAIVKTKANLQLFEYNGNLNQKFIFKRLIYPEKTVNSGTYYIKNGEKYLSIENGQLSDKSKLVFNELSENDYQKWNIKSLEDGYYMITSAANKKFSLDIAGASLKMNSKIQMFTKNNGDNQQWIIKDNHDGTFKIISKLSGLTLENDEYLYTKVDNNVNTQNFTFESTNIGSRTIEDGDYTITTKLNRSLVLGSAENGNVLLEDNTNKNSQIWNFKYQDNGFYKILSKDNATYCLGIPSNKFNIKENISISECSEANSQLWELKKDEKGYYEVRSFDDDYAVDIAGGVAKNKANIQIFTYHGNDNQKYMINKVITGEKTIENGIYTLKTLTNQYISTEKETLDIKTNIVGRQFSDDYSQKWAITYINNGYYEIKPINGLSFSMDVAGASKLNNANAKIFTKNNGDNQKWIIKDNEDGTYTIYSKCNGLALNIVNGNVQLNDFMNLDSEKIVIETTSIGKEEIEDGYYFINSKLNNNRSIDVPGGSAKENTNIQLFTSNSGTNQKWHFKYLGEGYYSILSDVNEEYALTLSATNNIQLNKFQNSDSQKWIVKNNGDNSYSIINNQLIGMALHNSQTANKTNILGEEYLANDNQRYILIRTAEGKSIDTLNNGYYIINSSMDNDYVIDAAGATSNNNTNIQLFQLNSKKNQKWYFEYNDKGYYIIRSGLDNTKVLTVDNNSPIKNVKLYSFNNTYEQQWVIKKTANDNYVLISNSNGQYFAAAEDNAHNNVNIQTTNNSNEQSAEFEITKTRLENIVIDISAHNGTVDWDRIKNDGQIYGAILRVAAGSYYTDSKLEENVSALNRLKIPYGIYIYSYAEDQIGTVPDLGTYHEAQLEAYRLITAIKNYNINPTLGIYYDLEVWENGGNAHWTSVEYEKIINNFHEVMSKNGYGDWKIYANLSMANSSLYPWRDRITWIAQWNDHCTYTSFYNLWQYTSNGHVDGVSTRVDMNIYYID